MTRGATSLSPSTTNSVIGLSGALDVADIPTLASVSTSAATTAAVAAHAAVVSAAGTHGLLKQILVAGQDETGDTTITVAGMVAADVIVSVLVLTTAASIATAAFRATTDFTTGAGVVNVVANAVNNTNNQYLISYLDAA